MTTFRPTRQPETTLAQSRPAPSVRNPGPRWGFRFLRFCDRVVPEIIFRPLRALGTWTALLFMPVQRRYSRDYLELVLGRKPRAIDLFRHFFAFEEMLMLKLRVANGRAHRGQIAPNAADFTAWLAGGKPALLGTFHVGTSDLLGFLLGGRERRRVYLVRQRVGNSHDTETLAALFGDHVRFVWVNEPGEMLFALKDAAVRGDGAIALQCDRLEFSSRVEAFEFLGACRLFPFTIYYLALIFELPVLLSVGIPSKDPEVSLLHSAPVFERAPNEPRAATLVRARAHFQEFLRELEKLLRDQPYQWFNFLPLNPPDDRRATPSS
jgi:predicted LPLAT superfamily acyltransferase